MFEGAILSTYTFNRYKSEKAACIEQIEYFTTSMTPKELLNLYELSTAVFYARDLVNENAHIVTPEYLAQEAVKLAKSPLLKCSVLKEKELLKNGCGLLYAVGEGAPCPPRLIVVEYLGNLSSKAKTALVGKGITFDSGGLNLKRTGHIESMRQDMAGAAAVLGTMKALTSLKLKINVIGVIPAAYNAIAGTAFYPGDIYRACNGKTVEIHSTDAEGRLILADAITYCQKKYKPTTIIDLATLTGSVIYALGDLMAGLYSNNDALATELFQAGEETNERLWRLPLLDAHYDAMKGDTSDLRNIPKLPKGHAGSITGAAFIGSFIENNLPWAHCDIAGTAFNNREERGEIPRNATGYGVRLLINYLKRKALR